MGRPKPNAWLLSAWAAVLILGSAWTVVMKQLDRRFRAANEAFLAAERAANVNGQAMLTRVRQAAENMSRWTLRDVEVGFNGGQPLAVQVGTTPWGTPVNEASITDRASNWRFRFTFDRTGRWTGWEGRSAGPPTPPPQVDPVMKAWGRVRRPAFLGCIIAWFALLLAAVVIRKTRFLGHVPQVLHAALFGAGLAVVAGVATTGPWPAFFNDTPGKMIVMFAATGVVLFDAVHRERRRLLRLARAGVCLGCGYDLRATPNRCPECGLVPAP